MNRRNFLQFLGAATIGSTVAYSFPSIIVPKNIITLKEVATDYLSEINLITKREIYPKLIEDFWFDESPFFSYLRKNLHDVKDVRSNNQI